MTRSSEGATWLLFITLAVIWGSSYLFIKIGVETISPLTLVALRLGIGALFLGGVALLVRQRLPREPRTYAHLTVMAVLNIVLPFSLITWAELHVASSLAAIVTAATPLFAIVIAALALRSEPITIQRASGLIVGFIGVVVLTGPAALGTEVSLAAVVALIVAAASYAAATVYARRTLGGLPPMVPALLQVSIALAISAPLALVLEQPLAIGFEPTALLALLWLGILGSGVAYLLYFRLIDAWGATRTAAVTYLMPVVGIALGVLVANEKVDPGVLVGTVLILGGVALVNARRIRRRWLVGRPASVTTEPTA